MDEFGLHDAIVVFAGSLPKIGLSKEKFMDMIRYVQQKGAVVALDTTALTAQQIVDLKPWIIKPNQEELEDMTGKKASSYEDIVAIAREIIDKGIENVVVSLGADGLIGINKDQAVKVDAVSYTHLRPSPIPPILRLQRAVIIAVPTAPFP